jgi:hypothetical protein
MERLRLVVHGLALVLKMTPFYMQSKEGLEIATDITRYML